MRCGFFASAGRPGGIFGPPCPFSMILLAMAERPRPESGLIVRRRAMCHEPAAQCHECEVIRQGDSPANQAGPKHVAGVMRATQNLGGSADQAKQENREKNPPAILLHQCRSGKQPGHSECKKRITRRRVSAGEAAPGTAITMAPCPVRYRLRHSAKVGQIPKATGQAEAEPERQKRQALAQLPSVRL